MADGTHWRGLDKALASMRTRLDHVARGITVTTWNGLLHRSPQYSGRLVASWTYNVNTPVVVDRSKAVPALVPGVGPRRAGDPQAIAVANAASAGRELKFKLGDHAYLSNGANHGEGYYASAAERGDIRLRFVNMRSHPAVARTLASIESRYATGVNRRSAGQLAALKIGGGHG